MGILEDWEKDQIFDNSKGPQLNIPKPKLQTKQPLWSIKDFSESVKLSYNSIQKKLQKTKEEDKPISVGKKIGKKTNLYLYKDLLTWWNKINEKL